MKVVGKVGGVVWGRFGHVLESIFGHLGAFWGPTRGASKVWKTPTPTPRIAPGSPPVPPRPPQDTPREDPTVSSTKFGGAAYTLSSQPETGPEPIQTTPKRPATTPHASHATTHTSLLVTSHLVVSGHVFAVRLVTPLGVQSGGVWWCLWWSCLVGPRCNFCPYSMIQPAS